ncbi:MAG: sulfotransferase [Verrucomicrobia bacterium]|nr:sulfotransferase [Verrucomicrobiota bacterium]
MLRTFIRSVWLHLSWFIHSLWPGSHPGASPGVGRLLFLFILFPLFLSLQLIHWICFFLDEVFFHSYRKVEIKAPVFITGIPRSGTTFVQRTLQDKLSGFTCFSTWEVILAPSIFQRKCMRLLARIDRILGGFGRKGLNAVVNKLSGNLRDVHEVGLSDPEEDYLALLPAGGCFILLFAFPFSQQLKQIGMLDLLNGREREGILQFYHRCLQKHLYCAPKNSRLLSKNAAFGSWIPELKSRYPDSSCVLCIREPSSAISSQLSSLEGARSLFGSDRTGEYSAKLILEVFTHNYLKLDAFTKKVETEVVILDQSDLRKDPGKLLAKLVDRLQLGTSEEIGRLRTLEVGKSSRHKHELKDHPIEIKVIKVCIEPSYQEMLRANQRLDLQ